MDRAVNESDKDAKTQIESVKKFLAATSRIKEEEITYELEPQ